MMTRRVYRASTVLHVFSLISSTYGLCNLPMQCPERGFTVSSFLLCLPFITMRQIVTTCSLTEHLGGHYLLQARMKLGATGIAEARVLVIPKSATASQRKEELQHSFYVFSRKLVTKPACCFNWKDTGSLPNFHFHLFPSPVTESRNTFPPHPPSYQVDE